MTEINIPCKRFTSGFLTSDNGFSKIIFQNSSLYLHILDILTGTRKGHTGSCLKKYKGYNYKVKITLPNEFYRFYGKIDNYKIQRIARAIDAYFKDKLVLYVNSKIEEGVTINKAIYMFIDYYHIDDSKTTSETLKKIFYRKNKSLKCP